MPGMLEVDIAGVGLGLLAERGVFWPEQSTLLIADPHFGKEATFRRHGVPVPRGSTDGTLRSIARMLRETKARQMVMLGDMFHARSSLTRDVKESLDAFFAAHRQVRFSLIRGNHDVHIGPLPTPWRVESVAELRIGGVAMSHHPTELPADCDLVLCGHLHPAIRLGIANDSVGKLPCFWFSERRLVLPAIGQFTGTYRIRPRPGDRVWMIVEDQVVAHRA